MLVTLHKIGEVHFRLLGTNHDGFHVKAINERFILLRVDVVVRTSIQKFHVVS